MQSLQSELQDVNQELVNLQAAIEADFQEIGAEISEAQCQTVQGKMKVKAMLGTRIRLFPVLLAHDLISFSRNYTNSFFAQGTL